jgi:N-formylglutamate amidohydrolase
MPSETDRNRTPQIVLGDRFGAACPPRLVSFVETFFKARGYSTARNHPYAGGHATAKHGRVGGRRHALQIEIRRDLYLNEDKVEPHDGLARLRTDLADLSLEATDLARQSVGLGPIGERKRPRRMPTRPRS